MLNLKYLDTIKDNKNNIISYEVLLPSGSRCRIPAEDLKKGIKENRIKVDKLSLNTNGRLVVIKSNIVILPNSLMSTLLQGSILCGITYNSIRFKSNGYKFLTKANMLNLIVVKLTEDIYKVVDNRNNMVIVCTKQLYLPVDCSGLFYLAELDHLDFEGVNTSLVENMTGMFESCIIRDLNLSNLNTRKVTNMSKMFYDSTLGKVDFSNFNTSAVIDMTCMFYRCKARNLNLSSFDTSNVKYFTDFSTGCHANLKIRDERFLLS